MIYIGSYELFEKHREDTEKYTPRSIDFYVPNLFNYESYDLLKPPAELFNYYTSHLRSSNTDEDTLNYTYKVYYTNEVLNKLNPKKLLDDLTYENSVVLLTNNECQRKVVFNWFNNNCIQCKELS